MWSIIWKIIEPRNNIAHNNRKSTEPTNDVQFQTNSLQHCMTCTASVNSSCSKELTTTFKPNQVSSPPIFFVSSPKACPFNPAIYIINVKSIGKLQAIEQFDMDLMAYDIDIRLVTETHLKTQQPDSLHPINGFTIFSIDAQEFSFMSINPTKLWVPIHFLRQS